MGLLLRQSLQMHTMDAPYNNDVFINGVLYMFSFVQLTMYFQRCLCHFDFHKTQREW